MTEQEKYYLNQMITEALTVNSDEIEGQQVINLNNLDLCAVDYAKTTVMPDPSLDMTLLNEIYSDSDIIKLLNASIDDIPNLLDDIYTDNNIIIEFADATVNDPNPVIYNISVKPGETINNDTIIGQVQQKGKMKTIKSIFSKGTVKGINDDTEFFHLYPSNCSRHIVLENVLDEDGEEFNLSSEIQELNDKFSKEGCLYALITNCLCQSLLPYILSHRYRGVYTRTFNGYGYSKWFLDSSDLIADNTEVSTFVNNNGFKNNKQYNTPFFIYDFENESHDTGLKIFDSSILKVLDEIQDEFGANIIGNDVTKNDMKSWKKRAKKKKKRKKVKQEIKQKTQNSTDKIKHSENPYEVLNAEKDRLLNTRNNYIEQVINLYKNKDKLPLCKYDPEYNDCKFLVNNVIDSGVLENVKNYDEDFTYSPIGDVDNYYNYYFSLLGNLNLLSENEYVQEYYELISDIINKRLIIETSDIKTLKRNFLKLFNDNVCEIFKFYQNENFNTEEYINHQFTKFENQINVFVQEQNTKHANDIRDNFTKMNLGEEAIENAGTLYTADNQYRQIYDYIKNLYSYSNDEDEETPNEIIAQLATLYTYIKSNGNAQNNRYKDLKTEDDKYIYLKLINEESKRLTEFWDRIILEYEQCSLNTCFDDLNNMAHKYDEYADWPLPTKININNVEYEHYLFTNIYEKHKDIDISIGDYDFPETVKFPDIPEDISVNEAEALEDLNNHEIDEFKDPNRITFLNDEYWQKYFTLATLICLVPSFWNCGLDIMPYIQNIPLPCIFIAIKCLHIPIFNMVIVFGIAIRGMYPWPIILYLNTSDQPISILTPLIAVLRKLKTVFNKKINKIEYKPLEQTANFYINKLNTEINEIKKENIKLDNYKRAIKNIKMPKNVKIGKEFELISHPDVDTRQKITRLEQLANRSKAKI